MKKIFLIPFFFLSGCRLVIYEAPDHRKIYYYAGGINTKLGTLEIKTPDGRSLILKDLDSNSQAIELATKALDLANKVP